MEKTALIQFITDYIASRRQPKIDAFEKEAAKRLEQGDDASAIAQERQELEARYLPRNWLTDAAKRVRSIRIISHGAKYSNGDSKAYGRYLEKFVSEGYLNTASLAIIKEDAEGNAAFYDVAKILLTDVHGDSLLASLKRGDYQSLNAFALDDEQLKQWVECFSQAYASEWIKAHKLSKQIYFPVDDGYHLLCPLFSSSLAQAMYENLTAVRFSEESKAIRDAHKAGKWHSQPDIRFPNLAEMHYGGGNQQNISLLNSARVGRVWLLPSMPPTWTTQERAPQNMRSIFALRGDFNRSASGTIARMTYLLKVDINNVHIRTARAKYIDELIDLLFMQASSFQQEKWQGWSAQSPELPRHQQLWLDPWRSLSDEAFKLEREKNDWQRIVADDFARWLNYRLKKASFDVGAVEQREWRSQSLFTQRMREMEAVLQEALK
ncbi:type I-F CRISPR-associated protein Csy1 [Escherichia coli]|uniref:type I-F CRISPR-associated protein Csy1 n=1 Tax=Escherichia TaxID=561 RepID=UPI001CE4819B|nr:MULTISPECIES: type I-F CRISPR-associated protein Csy1 [Escherichia]UHR05820.1 type I-F CRISPR-associated protein Csy1 [Escherichia coli]